MNTNVGIENNQIRIRDFTRDDLPLMLKWLTDDRVLEFYEGRDVLFNMETLAEHFLEEIPDGFRMIIEYNGQAVGYGQAYQLSGEMFEEYNYHNDGRVVFAMDQFIGEPDYWNRGIGSEFLRMMASYLKTARGAACILLDPHQNNHRAIRAYEKAGFRIIKPLPEHELFEGKKEDCWLMEKVLQTLEFKKFTDFPRGTMYDILCDAYSYDARNKKIWDSNWKESDDFFYDNPEIAEKYGLVTCIDGAPIGFVTWDPRKQPDYVEIGHNGIREKYKRQGYGHKQLEEALRRIKEYEGLKRIIVCTNSNLAAPKNYESVGFKLYNRKPNETESAFTGDFLYYEIVL